MGLHHRYYADDIDYSPTPRTQPYAEMQKQIGEILREQYQPPQELPHQLLVLLLKVDQQGRRRETPWRGARWVSRLQGIGRTGFAVNSTPSA
jgi:hypothetical protein